MQRFSFLPHSLWLWIPGILLFVMEAPAQIDLEKRLDKQKEALEKEVEERLDPDYYLESWKKKGEKRAEARLDSLEKAFWAQGRILLDSASLEWKEALRSPPGDTVILAEQDISLPPWNKPVSWTFELEQGDTLAYRLRPGKVGRIHEVTLFAGLLQEQRQRHVSNRHPFEGKWVASRSISLTLTARNNMPLALPAHLVVQVLKRQKRIVERIRLDTLWQEQPALVQLRDTQTLVFLDQTFTLFPRRDITHPAHILLPWRLPERPNLLQWGYWIGVGEEVLAEYDELTQMTGGQSPLLAWLRAERTSLPVHRISAVEHLLCAPDQAKKALRGQAFREVSAEGSPLDRPLYRRIAGKVPMPSEGWQSVLLNRSDLYDYPVRFVGVMQYVDVFEVTEKVPVMEVRPYTELTLE